MGIFQVTQFHREFSSWVHGDTDPSTSKCSVIFTGFFEQLKFTENLIPELSMIQLPLPTMFGNFHELFW